MKKLLSILMMVVCTWCVSLPVQAQQTNAKQRITREQLAEVQAKHIASNLALNNELTAKFIETYTQCQKEVWALGPRPKYNSQNSEEQTEQQMQKRFEMSEKLLAIRQKYYKKYSTFLTQKQIERVYQMEKQMMQRFANKRAGQQRQRRGI